MEKWKSGKKVAQLGEQDVQSVPPLKVFPDKELMHYFGKLIASSLKGRNSDKIFAVHSGRGNNSKSMIGKLLEHTFGDYLVKVQPTFLTGKNRTNSSSASPEVAQFKHKKVILTDEPSSTEGLKDDVVKLYCGDDSFFVRTLHDKGGKVKATAKLIMNCNQVPESFNTDEAMRNRVRIITHLSRWDKNAPKTDEEQMAKKLFPQDTFFSRKIPELKEAFLWILVQYYPKYIHEGLTDPLLVQQETAKYWGDNDVYCQFVEDRLTRITTEHGIPDKRYSLALTVMYDHFKIWYQNGFPGRASITRTTFKTEISKNRRLGPQDSSKRWIGVRFKEEGDTVPEKGKDRIPDI